LAQLAKDQPEENRAKRKGASGDAKANAAVQFAAKVAKERGHVRDPTSVGRDGGFTDAQVVEIIALVAEQLHKTTSTRS